ncbi:Na+/H+ antiporter subunit E [Alteromonas halophila]|uniref:Monovalent cation/H+ antiporter subunit E n=1 Tax=Alteromonas halophila TaxID=516698 RepID=A0A918JIW6_9ALTE|nr:Na+/H+ antiporter subunit E [Alteromonas halophila]GGW83201.1 monovalent cation/H+ antiporter subunit E [Alteromonas halophila]
MSMLSRIIPKPVTSFLLLVVWLMLNVSVSPGHILLGAVFAIIIPLLCAPLQIPQPKVKRPFRAVRYVLMVAGDIIVANVQVAILVIGPMRRIKPGFIAVPLDLEEDFPITILANTVTMTPGTLSAELSKDKNWLYVHVLSMPDDEQEIISLIKQRYELAIREIFKC